MTGGDEMCNLYLMYYTDREKGVEVGACGGQEDKELTKRLPKDSTEPLPANPQLESQSLGENKNLVSILWLS